MLDEILTTSDEANYIHNHTIMRLSSVRLSDHRVEVETGDRAKTERYDGMWVGDGVVVGVS